MPFSGQDAIFKAIAELSNRNPYLCQDERDRLQVGGAARLHLETRLLEVQRGQNCCLSSYLQDLLHTQTDNNIKDGFGTSPLFSAVVCPTQCASAPRLVLFDVRHSRANCSETSEWLASCWLVQSSNADMCAFLPILTLEHGRFSLVVLAPIVLKGPMVTCKQSCLLFFP